MKGYLTQIPCFRYTADEADVDHDDSLVYTSRLKQATHI